MAQPIDSQDKMAERIRHLENQVRKLVTPRQSYEKTSADEVRRKTNPPIYIPTQPIYAIDTGTIDMTMIGQQLSAEAIPAGIDHDALLNYSANEHVDHTGVSITAGAGLTGGGDLSANRTLAVGAGALITVAADSVGITSGSTNQYIGTGAGTSATWQSNAALTKTNDTNVTLTLGGTPETSLLKAVSLALGWTGTLAFSRLVAGTESDQFIATGASPFTPAYRLISTLAGAGLTSTSGVLAVGAGNGITVNTDDVAVNPAYNFIWTGTHTFQSNINARHIVPELGDTYDLGSSTLLWRKGYLSELEALVFAQNTITLLGGWLMICKNEGTFPLDVPDDAVKIDFGMAMTINDFVLCRAAGKVEYIRVNALDSGTTYLVTRNLDGSGANDWAAGTPFAVLGQSGDGRIELNAYDTPRIQVVTQGATYNAQTEVMRMGDLKGWWNYESPTIGIALGEYAANKPNITIDSINGLRIRNYNTNIFSFDTSGNADIASKLRMPGISSAIAIGATPPTAADVGTGIWIDRTGLYSLASDICQVKIDTTNGKLYAGEDAVQLGISGLRLKCVEYVEGEEPPDIASRLIWLKSQSESLRYGYIGCTYITTGGGDYATLLLSSEAPGGGEVNLEADDITIIGHTKITFSTGYLTTDGGLHIGGTSDPGADNLIVDGTSTLTGVVIAGSYLTTVGGVHIGGMSNPGADNLWVDQDGLFRYGADGQVTIGGHAAGALELGKQGRSSASTPFIDFHSSTNDIDYDVRIIASGGSATVGQGLLTLTAGGGVKISGAVGFNNTSPLAKPTVTGSRGGNAALANLLTSLANYGLITDSSTT